MSARSRTRSRPVSLLLAVLLVTTMLPVAPAAGAGTWSVVADLETYNSVDIEFADTNTGWVIDNVGGGIYKTTDGGFTWGSAVPTYINTPQDMHFTSASEGWVVGAGRVSHTTDGGATWVWSSISPVELRGVYFIDPQTGWAVGDAARIFKTADAGATWTEQTSGVVTWYDVHFVSATTGWAVGANGWTLKTVDGGANWTSVAAPTSQYLMGVHFVDAMRGWAVGNSGVIISTSDGGASWTARDSGTTVNLSDVHFTDTNNGWAAGASGTILRTADGGLTWTPQQSGTSENLLGLHAMSDALAWAIGSTGDVVRYVSSNEADVSVSAEAPAPAELSLTFSVTAGMAPEGGSVTDSSIDFATLAANTPKTGSHTLQVTTNASNGYQVTGAENAPLTSGAYTIPDVTGDGGDITEALAGAWTQADTYGFGYTLADQTGTSAAFTSGYKQFADTSAAETAQILMQGLAATTGDAVELTYKLNIGPAQVQGTYANTVTYVATGNL